MNSYASSSILSITEVCLSVLNIYCIHVGHIRELWVHTIGLLKSKKAGSGVVHFIK